MLNDESISSINHQGNVNLNHSKIPLHTQNDGND